MNAKEALEKTKENVFTLERIQELISHAASIGKRYIKVVDDLYVSKDIKHFLSDEGYDLYNKLIKGKTYLVISWT